MVNGRKQGSRSCCELLGRSFKCEFQCRSFGLYHSDPYQLSLPQWEWADGPLYVAFRFIVATLLVTWLCCEIPFEVRHQKPGQPLLFFTYGTEWAFILYTLTSIGFAGFCIFFAVNKERQPTTCCYRSLWFFFGLSANIILTTSGIYWIAMWDKSYTYFFQVQSKLKHSIPAAIVLIDMCLNNVPIRLLHGVYPMLLGIFYTLFTYVYWVCGYLGFTGDGIIYPIMNWNKPGYAVAACFLALLFCIIIQFLLYFISFTRIYISYMLGGRGTTSVRELYPEAIDEFNLLPNEGVDLLDDDRQDKTYASLQ